MGSAIIFIESPCHIKVKNSIIEINLYDKNTIEKIACLDIATLMIASNMVTITSQSIIELNRAKAVVVFCDNKFLPISACMSSKINLKGSNRIFKQAKRYDERITKKWHKEIIFSKILSQSYVLKKIDKDISLKLENLAKNIEDGDSSNIEATAARFYWNSFFNHLCLKAKRDKRGAKDIINISLNYGYSIIRSSIARSLMAYSLDTRFGIIHKRRDNPFNLVEDFVEPFRYICDLTVINIFYKKRQIDKMIFDKNLKHYILESIISSHICLFDKKYRFMNALDIISVNYCKVLKNSKLKLMLPFLKHKNQKIQYDTQSTHI